FVSHSPISFPFFSNVLSTTQLSSLSLHDALPISADTAGDGLCDCRLLLIGQVLIVRHLTIRHDEQMSVIVWKQIHHHVNELTSRSEEHTSELQSRENLVCRLLLEKKKKNKKIII